MAAANGHPATAKGTVEREREWLGKEPAIQQLVERKRKQHQPHWQVMALAVAQILAVTVVVAMILLYTVDNRVTAYYWGLAVAGVLGVWEYDRMRRRSKFRPEVEIRGAAKQNAVGGHSEGLTSHPHVTTWSAQA
jgi:hypothetical protein